MILRKKIIEDINIRKTDNEHFGRVRCVSVTLGYPFFLLFEGNPVINLFISSI